MARSMTVPHIAHVVHCLDVGGTENGLVNLINELHGDFRHSVVSMTDAGPLSDRLPAGVTVHCLGKRPGIDLGASVRLACLLRRLAPQVVHSRNWGAFDAVLAARLARVPSILHGEHGREATDPHGVNKQRNRLRRLVAPLVDTFISVSSDLRRWLIETVRIPPRKVVTIPNGVDTERFSGDGREAARATFGLAPDVVVVGTVGRLDPVKDQTVLLEAVAQASAAHPALAAVIVGDGPCRPLLEARARQADLAGRVHLLGYRADIPTLLKTLDIYALPSLAEGMSNTILEAMATGLPVVATRTGGNPELIEHDVTGILVPISDPASLAKALAGYLDDPRLRLMHGLAARRRVIEHFSLHRMAASYRELYRGHRPESSSPLNTAVLNVRP